MTEEIVLDSDNGLIAIALGMYIKTATEMGGDQKLIDRASELEFIFKNKSPSEKYDWESTGLIE